MSKLRKAAEISKARVLIVDDQPVVRERLGQLVSSEPDMVFCGDADDPRMALELAAATEPDVIVTGLSLKDSHGALSSSRISTCAILRFECWSFPCTTNPCMRNVPFGPGPAAL